MCPSAFPLWTGGYSEIVERDEDGGIWVDEGNGLQQAGGGDPKDGSHPVGGRALLPDHHVRGDL
jgi:hypothetical protein